MHPWAAFGFSALYQQCIQITLCRNNDSRCRGNISLFCSTEGVRYNAKETLWIIYSEEQLISFQRTQIPACCCFTTDPENENWRHLEKVPALYWGKSQASITTNTKALSPSLDTIMNHFISPHFTVSFCCIKLNVILVYKIRGIPWPSKRPKKYFVAWCYTPMCFSALQADTSKTAHDNA
jgi:hypothetical protein